MRKWFWCCTAAGLMAAGVVGTVRYCQTHPNSAATIGLAAVCGTNLYASRSPLGAEPSPSCVDDGRSAAPVLQLELPGTSLPQPIVIRDDDELNEPPLAENEHEVAGCLIGMADEWQARPGEFHSARLMPYADDEPVCGHETCNRFSFWGCLAPVWNCGECVKAGACVACMKMDGCGGDPAEEHEGPSLWRRFVQAITGGGTGGAAEETQPMDQSEPMGDANDLNRHYHDHDLSCPYSGRSCPATPYAPRPVPVEGPKQDPAKGSSEESETVKPMKLGSAIKPMRLFNDPLDLLQWRPAFPRIDTMEFRPSDHRLNEYSCVHGAL